MARAVAYSASASVVGLVVRDTVAAADRLAASVQVGVGVFAVAVAPVTLVAVVLRLRLAVAVIVVELQPESTPNTEPKYSDANDDGNTVAIGINNNWFD